MPTKKNINMTEPEANVETVTPDAVETTPIALEKPIKKAKKNTTDTKALKKELTEVTTKLSEESAKVAQLENMLEYKQAELDKATKIIERLTQEYSRRTRFILNTISQAHQAINMVLEEK